MMTAYYNEKIECMSQDEIKKLQLTLLNKQLKRANQAPAYRGKLPDAVQSLSEIKNLPFTTKEDLRQNFPYGYVAVPEDKITRTCATSGTTGTPIYIFFSEEDVKNIALSKAQHYFCAGLQKGKKVQCMLNVNLSVSGLCCDLVSKFIAANFIPTGTGNTLKQMEVLKGLNADFLFTTPNYLMHLCHLSTAEHINLQGKRAIVCGEPCTPLVREKLLSDFGVEVFDNYGLTEMGGGVAAECSAHEGLHVSEDYFYVEVIDPDTGVPVPDGEYGELVITPLQQEAMPLIRYRTRDITRIIPQACPCGRTHRRIEPISYRIDDMMIINGVNVFPSQIEECIYKYFATVTDYLIHITEK
ncbi:MAG: AMP-binding protein, partial [Alphaproteobacteria bacterium]|nr:AMP-binding protein [Alphaproteobacteria bacterium]